MRVPDKDGGPEQAYLGINEALSPLKYDVWKRLSPRERLARSWSMGSRPRDPAAIHDRKLFPKP
jgi:hypothetical protein